VQKVNKSDAQEEKKSTRAVYEFYLSSGKLKKEPFLLIHKKDFNGNENEVSNFYPSAIAVALMPVVRTISSPSSLPNTASEVRPAMKPIPSAKGIERLAYSAAFFRLG
jgi:hypothetical protein